MKRKHKIGSVLLSETTQSTRRSFLKQSASLASLTLIPHSVMGGGTNFKSPNEKLNIAIVGTHLSERISQHICSENIVAHYNEAWLQTNHGRNFQEMLVKRTDIDAVVVATPDHLLAEVSLAAMQQGKHVFSPAPLAQTVTQAQRITEAAKTSRVVTQMAVQETGSDTGRRACIEAGTIGAVHEVHVWGQANTNSSWQQRWDSGTGALGHPGCQMLAPVFRALKLGYPTSLQATSSRMHHDVFPQASMVRFAFPARGRMPAVTVTWYDGGLRPPCALDIPRDVPFGNEGILYIGEQGKILNQTLITKSGTQAISHDASTNMPTPDIYQEWIRACKEGTPTESNFAWAGPLSEVVLMGNIALRPEVQKQMARQKLLWDQSRSEFTNLPEANQYLYKA